jgi:hypothetical protein
MTYLHNIVKFRGVPRILDLDRQISIESPLKLPFIGSDFSQTNHPDSCPTNNRMVAASQKMGGGSIPQKPNPQIKDGMLGNSH